MDETKLKALIDYLKALTQLQRNGKTYVNREIDAVKEAIEKELKLK